MRHLNVTNSKVTNSIMHLHTHRLRGKMRIKSSTVAEVPISCPPTACMRRGFRYTQYAYMYVYIYNHVRTYTYVYVYVYNRVHTYTNVYVHIYITFQSPVHRQHVCVVDSDTNNMRISMYTYTIMYARTHMYMYMCTIMYTRTHVYVHICITFRSPVHR